MIAGLLSTSGLSRLSLAHCGRGFTERAARTVGAAALSGLTHLALGGAHVLSDAALAALLRCMPGLRSLRIADSPILTGAFLAELPVILPALEVLELSGCALIGDAAILGAPLPQQAAAAGSSTAKKVGAAAPKKAKAAAARGAAGDSGDGEDVLVISDDEEEGKEADGRVAGGAAGASRSSHAGAAGNNSDVNGSAPRGVSALRSLTSLALAHLPLVTDAAVTAVIRSSGGRLRGLSLVRCPGIKGDGGRGGGGRKRQRQRQRRCLRLCESADAAQPRGPGQCGRRCRGTGEGRPW
jgi:hypothetical protein